MKTNRFYNEVTVDQLRVKEHEVGPFYYYNTSLLKQTLDSIKREIVDTPHFHVHYAIKANANVKLLNIIKQAELGVDCVSGGEVRTAIEVGFDAQKIVFAGVGKSDKEIEYALAQGISCFNVESIPELEVINECAARMKTTAHVAFRINPNVDAHTHEKITTGLNENKFGLAMEDMLPAIQIAKEMEHIEVVGLHFHIGSQILHLEVFKTLCAQINELQLQLLAAGFTPKSINVGGGLGINYDNPNEGSIPDFKMYFQIFKDNLELQNGQQVHFELGRSIVAQCGALISRVLYMKQGHTKKFLIIDAGFTELVRPAMYGSLHYIENLSAVGAPVDHYDIVGPICESSDVFAKDYELPTSSRGDIIAIRSAGAYGEVMASTYNCRTLPQSFLDTEIN
ncbi:MAG: diaminopimelate decarboxylase [Bacteroidaceae bacterium]|nr:diaminopimelate decarboxylase [Bacteroidaceae bacterium]